MAKETIRGDQEAYAAEALAAPAESRGDEATPRKQRFQGNSSVWDTTAQRAELGGLTVPAGLLKLIVDAAEAGGRPSSAIVRGDLRTSLERLPAALSLEMTGPEILSGDEAYRAWSDATALEDLPAPFAPKQVRDCGRLGQAAENASRKASEGIYGHPNVFDSNNLTAESCQYLQSTRFMNATDTVSLMRVSPKFVWYM